MGHREICPDLFDYYNFTWRSEPPVGNGLLLEDKTDHMVNQLADAVADMYLPCLCISVFLAMANFVGAYLEIMLINDLCYRSKSKVFCNDSITYRSEWVAKEKLKKTSPSSRCRLYDALGGNDEYSDEELSPSNSMLLQFNSIGIALLKKNWILYCLKHADLMTADLKIPFPFDPYFDVPLQPDASPLRVSSAYDLSSSRTVYRPEQKEVMPLSVFREKYKEDEDPAMFLETAHAKLIIEKHIVQSHSV
jgi:hypothetical protein